VVTFSTRSQLITVACADAGCIVVAVTAMTNASPASNINPAFALCRLLDCETSFILPPPQQILRLSTGL